VSAISSSFTHPSCLGGRGLLTVTVRSRGDLTGSTAGDLSRQWRCHLVVDLSGVTFLSRSRPTTQPSQYGRCVPRPLSTTGPARCVQSDQGDFWLRQFVVSIRTRSRMADGDGCVVGATTAKP
jgi:hypothetical protein